MSKIEEVIPLIRAALNWIKSTGVVPAFEMESVDFVNSAVRALEGEKLFDGAADLEMVVFARACRFALAAVDFEHNPIIVLDEDLHLAEYLKLDEGACAFLSASGVDHSVPVGDKQAIHSDLMVTSPDQLVVGSTYFQFHCGMPYRLIVVDSVDLVKGMINYHEPGKTHGNYDVCSMRDYGMLPYNWGQKGWNRVNWLETVDSDNTME